MYHNKTETRFSTEHGLQYLVKLSNALLKNTAFFAVEPAYSQLHLLWAYNCGSDFEASPR